MLEPHPDRIDLWLAWVDPALDADLLQRYHRLLNPAEAQTLARFHFEKDRLRYLLTRALVRTVLSLYAPIAPQDWAFDANAYGKPGIAPAHHLMHPHTQSLVFNVSHTATLVVMAVSADKPLGVDVESLQRKAPLDLAQAYFSPAEAAALAQLAPELQAQRFFQYWTLKEAYIKARGMGLSIPLDQFSFAFEPPAGVRFATDPGLGDEAAQWQFWQYRVATHQQMDYPVDHLVALCAQRQPHSAPVQQVWRVVVPLGAEHTIHPELLAASIPS